MVYRMDTAQTTPAPSAAGRLMLAFACWQIGAEGFGPGMAWPASAYFASFKGAARGTRLSDRK